MRITRILIRETFSGEEYEVDGPEQCRNTLDEMVAELVLEHGDYIKMGSVYGEPIEWHDDEDDE